jgi:hypothetical protein
MNGTVHPAAAPKAFIRRIGNGIYGFIGNITLNKLDSSARHSHLPQQS